MADTTAKNWCVARYDEAAGSLLSSTLFQTASLDDAMNWASQDAQQQGAELVDSFYVPHETVGGEVISYVGNGHLIKLCLGAPLPISDQGGDQGGGGTGLPAYKRPDVDYGGGDQGGATDVQTFTPDETAVIMEGVDAGCDACDSELGEVILRLVTSLEPVLVENDKEITRLRRKITRLINRQQSECGNLLEKIATNIGNYVTNEAYTCQILLGDLRDKIAAWPRPETPTPAAGATQVTIDLKPLVDGLACVCEVLKEIRDRLGGVPHEEKGELPSEDFAAEFAPPEFSDKEPVAVAFAGVTNDVDSTPLGTFA